MRIHVPKSQRSDCVTVRHDGLVNSLREQMNRPEAVPSGAAQVRGRLRRPMRSGPIAHPAPLPLFAWGPGSTPQASAQPQRAHWQGARQGRPARAQTSPSERVVRAIWLRVSVGPDSQGTGRRNGGRCPNFAVRRFLLLGLHGAAGGRWMLPGPTARATAWPRAVTVPARPATAPCGSRLPSAAARRPGGPGGSSAASAPARRHRTARAASCGCAIPPRRSARLHIARLPRCPKRRRQ